MHTLRSLRVWDSDYPPRLRELKSPPEQLVVQGSFCSRGGVAIVGTRTPTAEAGAFSRELAGSLAARGIVVLSGGAAGIDASAHQGALDCGAPTVVVMGTGHDYIYPPGHEGLFASVLEHGGALVSPFAPHQPPAHWTFLRRNHVLAALADAVVLVEAPLKSGARSTAAAARSLGRPVYVVPYPPWTSAGAGNHAELALGGIPYKGLEDLLRQGERAPPPPSTRRVRSQPPPHRQMVESLNLCAASRRLLEVTSETPLHVDQLMRVTPLPADQFHEALLTLTLEAVLVEGPAGWYRRVK